MRCRTSYRCPELRKGGQFNFFSFFLKKGREREGGIRDRKKATPRSSAAQASSKAEAGPDAAVPPRCRRTNGVGSILLLFSTTCNPCDRPCPIAKSSTIIRRGSNSAAQPNAVAWPGTRHFERTGDLFVPPCRGLSWVESRVVALVRAGRESLDSTPVQRRVRGLSKPLRSGCRRAADHPTYSRGGGGAKLLKTDCLRSPTLPARPVSIVCDKSCRCPEARLHLSRERRMKLGDFLLFLAYLRASPCISLTIVSLLCSSPRTTALGDAKLHPNAKDVRRSANPFLTS